MRVGSLCIRVGVLVRKGGDARDLSHYTQEQVEDTGIQHKNHHLEAEECSPQKTSQLLT